MLDGGKDLSAFWCLIPGSKVPSPSWTNSPLDLFVSRSGLSGFMFLVSFVHAMSPILYQINFVVSKQLFGQKKLSVLEFCSLQDVVVFSG